VGLDPVGTSIDMPGNQLKRLKLEFWQVLNVLQILLVRWILSSVSNGKPIIKPAEIWIPQSRSVSQAASYLFKRLMFVNSSKDIGITGLSPDKPSGNLLPHCLGK